MIALPGLTLATGRADEAADILRTFARYVDQGMLPNNFPDRAARARLQHRRRHALVRARDPRLRRRRPATAPSSTSSCRCSATSSTGTVRGTRYGIGVDPADGLLRAGEPGVQLTWMDAKSATGSSRRASASRSRSRRSGTTRCASSPRFSAPARRQPRGCLRRAGRAGARESFQRASGAPTCGYLADVVDGPDGDELHLRPNQIFALSLPYPLLDGATWPERVVDAVGRALLTPYGLRSLSPDDPAYRGDYGGDRVRRDGGLPPGPGLDLADRRLRRGALPRPPRPRRGAGSPASIRAPPARRRPRQRLRNPRRRRAAPAARRDRPGVGRGRSAARVAHAGNRGMMSLAEPLRLVAQGIATLVEGIGVLIVAVAVVLATVRFVTGLVARRRTLPSDSVRLALGRSLALSLEFLLGADILRTAVEPSWDEIGRLAAIATIRTALNYFLQREIAAEARMTTAEGLLVEDNSSRMRAAINALELSETTSVWLLVQCLGLARGRAHVFRQVRPFWRWHSR